MLPLRDKSLLIWDDKVEERNQTIFTKPKDTISPILSFLHSDISCKNSKHCSFNSDSLFTHTCTHHWAHTPPSHHSINNISAVIWALCCPLDYYAHLRMPYLSLTTMTGDWKTLMKLVQTHPFHSLCASLEPGVHSLWTIQQQTAQPLNGNH